MADWRVAGGGLLAGWWLVVVVSGGGGGGVVVLAYWRSHNKKSPFPVPGVAGAPQIHDMMNRA